MRTITVRTRVRDRKTGRVRPLKGKAPRRKAAKKRTLKVRRKAPKHTYRRKNGKRVAGKRISRMV